MKRGTLSTLLELSRRRTHRPPRGLDKEAQKRLRAAARGMAGAIYGRREAP